MTPDQAKLLHPHFTAKEIEATGAKLEDVSYELMRMLRLYRIFIAASVHLLPGGLTTGKHEPGSYHYRAEGAVDFHHAWEIRPDQVVEGLLNVGFRGIGVYWNGVIHSYHADRRDNVALWRGTKRKGERAWTYGDLVKIP